MKPEDDNGTGAGPAALRYRIKDLPQHERPRERLRDLGPAALSNAELLAILLRTGTSRFTAIGLASNLLSRFGSLNNLAQVSVAELARTYGRPGSRLLYSREDLITRWLWLWGEEHGSHLMG